MTVQLSELCKIHVPYEGANYVDLSYVERSPDHWYSDTETDLEIDKQKAQEIVDFLTAHFKL